MTWFCDLDTDEDEDEEDEIVADEFDLFVEASIGSVDRRDQPVVHSDKTIWRSFSADWSSIKDKGLGASARS